MLGYLTQFMPVQALIILAIAAWGIIWSLGYQWRKATLNEVAVAERKDAVEERSHKRRVEWHNVQHAPMLQGKTQPDEADET